jgi:eukaryotic translation initiation factor 2C
MFILCSPVCLCVALASCREKEYKVVIKDASKIDMYSLQQFLAGRQREMQQEIIQALDIALRECPSSR